ncbi:MAG: 4'-phosphopantetheinyl transferase family protein, partial [Nitrospinales bacterium]
MNDNCNWPNSPTDLYLSGGDVHIWCASLNSPDYCVEQMAQTLSTDELRRAERFHFMQHRNQFITAHGLLRNLLADYLNIEAYEIAFDYGGNGKPFLSEKFIKEKIRFNLSHSNGYALMAFAQDREVGVDIEYIRDFADMYMVARQVFSHRDNAILQSFTEIEKKRAF